jgi:hypothetical protein
MMACKGSEETAWSSGADLWLIIDLPVSTVAQTREARNEACDALDLATDASGASDLKQ